jgi:hypothetical protein
MNQPALLHFRLLFFRKLSTFDIFGHLFSRSSNFFFKFFVFILKFWNFSVLESGNFQCHQIGLSFVTLNFFKLGWVGVTERCSSTFAFEPTGSVTLAHQTVPVHLRIPTELRQFELSFVRQGLVATSHQPAHSDTARLNARLVYVMLGVSEHCISSSTPTCAFRESYAWLRLR